MMVSRDGAFGVLIGAAVGTFLLVPAHGAAQDSASASCAYVSVLSPLEDLLRCAEQGNPRVQLTLGLKYASGDGIAEDEFVRLRTERDATLQVPNLLLPSVQVNMRAGRLPPPEDNGISYLKLPLNAL